MSSKVTDLILYGYMPLVSSYMNASASASAYADPHVSRSNLNVLNMDNPVPSAQRTMNTPQPPNQQSGSNQQSGPGHPPHSLLSRESPSHGTANQRPNLQAQLDALLKTQND